jgi:hypothetical protein
VHSAPNLVRAGDVAPVRWRNGGGLTRELLAWPRAEDWVVRVSVADIAADGPFSSYPGVERWFAVLEGEGIELSGEEGSVRLRPGDAIHRLRGESATACRLLGGATRDFNVMVRREAASAKVDALSSAGDPAADWTGCFAVAPSRARLAGEGAWRELPALALAWSAAPARLEVEPRAPHGWRIDVTLVRGRT